MSRTIHAVQHEAAEWSFCGGLDKIELAKGRKAIEQELYRKIPPLLEMGGYIPHIDHAISPELSYDDMLYYMELKRKLIRPG